MAIYAHNSIKKKNRFLHDNDVDDDDDAIRHIWICIYVRFHSYSAVKVSSSLSSRSLLPVYISLGSSLIRTSFFRHRNWHLYSFSSPVLRANTLQHQAIIGDEWHTGLFFFFFYSFSSENNENIQSVIINV